MSGAPEFLSSSSLLTASQRRTVGFALSLTAVFSALALVIIAFIALGRMVSFFSGVLWPLAVAGVLALMLRPIVDLIIGWLHLRRTTAVVVIYGTALLICAGTLLLLLPPLVDQVLDFIGYAPTMGEQAGLYIETHYPDWVTFAQRQLANPLIRQMAENLGGEFQNLLKYSLPTLRSAGGGLLGIGAFATHLAIVPVYLFFFLLSEGGDPTKNLPNHLPFLKPALREDLVFLVREFIGIVASFFRGQMLIGLIMGAMLAIGFSVIGLKFGLFIGLGVGVLNIVPYLGSIIGIAITLPLAFLQPEGGWKLVGLVVAVKIVVQLIEGWVLTPKIMGARTGLHPVTIIVAIFFWGTAFDGVLGMVLAIPLTAFFVTAWRLAKHKYFAT
ncbi:MAG: AI-2E family transporter [Opitutaceae bacterium]|jgi:predicted PurR-regulated permease PerM